VKRAISILLSSCLGLFVASGVVSFVDDSLQLLWGCYFLTIFSGILSFFAVLTALVVYGLIGFLPMIPKRVFLPVTLFYLIGFLAVFPVAIYGYGDFMRRGMQLDWVMSFCQAVVGLGILYWLWGGWKFRWPLVEDKYLGDGRFSWRNLSTFVLANVFVLAPAIFIYLFLCTSLAVNHFTAGFLALHPGGLIARVRQYVRSDGKTIELVPMAHIADANFYRELSRSFPTNSIVLMEGVTDERNLLTNGISYKRMAHSLGLVEQQKVFKPQGQVVMADIDVDQFTTNTIAVLNLAMLIHTKGVNADTMMAWSQYSPPPNFLEQLDDDIVRKRNEHLLEILKTELPESDTIIVPWGAGHMPGIADAIQKEGFHLARTEEYTVIRF
jgi:hypothetical protein